MAVIDLSQLPAPQVIEVPNFETLLAERKEALIALYPMDEQAAMRRVLALEFEPIVKNLQESIHREVLLRQRIKEAAQAVMVAYAIGSYLEPLAACNNVKRLTITPANPDAVPPVDAVMELDDALRGKRAVITGGGRGFDQVLCVWLARKGAEVSFSARQEENIQTIAACRVLRTPLRILLFLPVNRV